jgi:hypothetical protein
MIRCWSHNNDVDQPAAYWWTTKAGNTVALCVTCCAWWRRHARDDPDLEPIRIQQIRRSP